ncbi:MAG: HAD family hydrolase [Kiritimatiellia bacterium]
MQSRHIIWDWNGTLIDDVDAGVSALNKMLATRGLATITRDFYRANFGFPVRPFYAQLGMNPDAEWERICVEFHDFFHAEPQHIRPDTRAALDYVRARGVHQSILSALRQDLLLRDTADAGLQEFFDEIYGVDNLDGATKLARGEALMARLRPQAPDAEFYFIGDTLHDAEVGTALGATPILVAGGHQTTARLEASGCRVAPSLLDAVKTILG